MPQKLRDEKFPPKERRDKRGFLIPPHAQRDIQPTQKPIVDLQVYSHQKPPLPRKPVDPAYFVPANTTIPYFPPQWTNPFYPYGYAFKPADIPIIKNYSINVAGPMDNHRKVSAIFEDVLPTKQFVNTPNTLGERLNIYNFVRSIFIKHSDGEDIKLEGSGNNSLLSYLKFMELNPYNTNHFTDNPYKGLPDNMLIYRSCYPIRYDKYSNSTQCAKNSIGMNIRIYKLCNEEYNIKKQELSNYYDFDIWREIAYYEYIREQIIKKKESPNFVLLYAYYICENCNIDFKKLAQIKGKYDEEQALLAKIECKHKKEECSCEDKKEKKFYPREYHYDHDEHCSDDDCPEKPGEYKSLRLEEKQKGGDFTISARKDPAIIIVDNEKAYSGRCIVALTESPTNNIYGWASRTYTIDGNIRRMVNTGFYKSEIWLSVLFQLMAALYVLQIHGIVFNNFCVEDNVYIKDVTDHSNITSYWKYKINGIEYYVPNYGYLVLIDSNFKDIEKSGFTLSKQNDCENFKILSNIFSCDGASEIDKKTIFNEAYKAFKHSFNPNTFSKAFTNVGGSKPPEDIIDLLDKISNDSTTNNIDHYLYTYMTPFMNNRIGTLLKETEVKNIVNDTKPFRK